MEGAWRANPLCATCSPYPVGFTSAEAAFQATGDLSAVGERIISA